jgi:hypothetical protein
MLYREIITVCSEIHTKHINTLRGHNVELLNVKLGCTYSDHWVLEGIIYVVHKYSLYRSVNTLHIRYKNQSVNVV